MLVPLFIYQLLLPFKKAPLTAPKYHRLRSIDSRDLKIKKVLKKGSLLKKKNSNMLSYSKKCFKSEFYPKVLKKEIHTKELLKKAAQKNLLTQKITQKRTKNQEIFFSKIKYLVQ